MSYLIISFALYSAVKVGELYPGPQENAEKQNAVEYQRVYSDFQVSEKSLILPERQSHNLFYFQRITLYNPQE